MGYAFQLLSLSIFENHRAIAIPNHELVCVYLNHHRICIGYSQVGKAFQPQLAKVSTLRWEADHFRR